MGSSQSFNTHDGDNNAYTATGRKKKQIILERQEDFPKRIQLAIRNAERKHSRRKPKFFLNSIERDFADWLFEAAIITSPEKSGETIYGLDDERDTEAEVELALRFFPKVLCMRRYGLFPIFWLTKSTRSVRFITLFARLGTELKLFRESERGGLVFGTNGSLDVFSQLAATVTPSSEQECAAAVVYAAASTKRGIHSGSKHHDGDGDAIEQHRQEIIDAKFLQVLKSLRQANLMKRDDIREYKLIDILCNQSVFPEKRFRYLVDWDPSSLLSNHVRSKTTTKKISMRVISRFFAKDDIAGIRMLFGLTMKYYPTELGFLFDTVYMVDENSRPSSFRKRPKKSNQSFDRKRQRPSFNPTDENHPVAATKQYPQQQQKKQKQKQLSFERMTSLFQFACDTYGKSNVQQLVDELLYCEMNKDPQFTRKAILRAATMSTSSSSCGSSQSIFWLMQKDPTLLQLTLANKVEPRRSKSIAARTA